MKIVLFGNYALYFIPRLYSFSDKIESCDDELWILQERKGNLLYDKLPQISLQGLNIAHLWDAPLSYSYKQKCFYMLDKLNPDVLVTGFVSFPYGAIGLQWAKSRHKAIIEYDDQRWNTFPRGKVSAWIKSRIIRNVDAFLCPAPAWDETLLKWGFKKQEIFYGLDTSDNDFWSQKVDRVSFENLPPSYFMTLGRQGSMKNLPFFLNAYLDYLKLGGIIPLVMVGDGPDHEMLVSLSNNNPNITFLPFQDREHIRELFVNMKALVLPSTKVETWGMVVNECMASGNIVAISNECGSSTTLVKNGINGFHFSPNSKKEIVDALFKIEKLSLKDEQQMHQKSLDIIKDLGVDRFSKGLYDACIYALNHKKKVWNPIDFILMKMWKGRFNIKEATK